MSFNQNQVQTQKQGLNTFLLQQKLQVLNLMHLPTLALESFIRNQLEENPVLEEGAEVVDEETFSNETENDASDVVDDKMNMVEEFYNDDDIPDYKVYLNNTSKDEPVYTSTASASQSFQEQLKDQLKVLPITDQIRQLAEYLIDSLDSDGYLRTPLVDLTETYGFAHGRSVDESQLEIALTCIQQLDPPGVGARTLQECLLLQIKRKDNSGEAMEHAKIILTDHFQKLHHKNYDKIMREMDIDNDKLKQALHFITHLFPKPVFEGGKELSMSQSIIPEFVVIVDEENIEVSLTSNPSTTIHINKDYTEIVKSETASRRQKTEFNYFRKKVDEAKWLIQALQQRENTLLEIMRVITILQKEYFLTGERITLKPMILEDISRLTGFDVSTVSRVTCNKYVQTQYGNILLKDLFSNSLQTPDGFEVSTEKIKQLIIDIIQKEKKDKPLTDFEIVNVLTEMGYKVARRTIVKYRESLNLPNARMRKNLL
jgi:RNA polymerase sigma-54 factor